MADITVHGIANTKSSRPTWHVFLALVTVATVLPFVVAPLASKVMPQDETGYLWFVILSFVGGNFHVATTGWFFADREMRQHFWRNKQRYIRLPLVVVAFTTLCSFNPDVFGYVLAAYYSWQSWHYQKQNVGLLSFIAAGTTKVPVSAWERRTLMLAWVPAGIVPPLKLLLPDQIFLEVQPWGLVAYVPVAVCLCLAVTKNPDLRTNLFRTGFLLSGVAFFAPLYIFPNMIAAVSSFAIAHGLQYLVFMGTISLRREHLFTMAALVGLAVAGGLALDHMQTVGGLFIGLIAVHYLYDADIWKLREPFQRNYMRRKFAFVFER